MKINRIQSSMTAQGVRWQAEVTWEDCSQPNTTLHITSPALREDVLPASFFLLNLLPKALSTGEKRVLIDAAINQQHHEYLPIALASLRSWFCPQHDIPKIETAGNVAQPAPAGGKCGLLLAGGVDSLATLLHNRKFYPREHPLAIEQAFLINGIDDGSGHSQDRSLCRETGPMPLLCAHHRIDLSPVYTNLPVHLAGPAGPQTLHHGMARSGLLHAFSHTIRHGLLPSGEPVQALVPHGSHLFIEPFCSSPALKIHLVLSSLRPLERIKLLAESEAALSCLQVCGQTAARGGALNCSRCHKCLFTMLSLLACDKLHTCPAFTHDEITQEMIHAYIRPNESSAAACSDLIEELEKAGRADLARALRATITASGNSSGELQNGPTAKEKKANAFFMQMKRQLGRWRP